MITTTLKKYGNSFTIVIPRAIVDLLDAKEGDVFEMDIKQNKIVLKQHPEV